MLQVKWEIVCATLVLTLHLVEQGAAVAAQPSVLAVGLRQALLAEVPAKQFATMGTATLDPIRHGLYHVMWREVDETDTHLRARRRAPRQCRASFWLGVTDRD